MADEPASTARMQAVVVTVQGDRHTIFGSNVACLRVSGFEGTCVDASVLRFSDCVEGRVSHELEKAKVTDREQETIDETLWQQCRLVHHPLRAKEQTAWRQAQINVLEGNAACWAGKLDRRDGCAKHHGRKLFSRP